MNRASKKLCACTAAVLLIAGFTAAQAGAAGPDSVAQTQATAAAAPLTFTQTVISDEQLTSRWAFVTRKVTARSDAHGGGHPVRKLTTRTPDGTNELVLILNERTYSDGTVWEQVRLPMRPANKTGWIRRDVLGKFNTIHTRMVISRNRFRATLYKNGKIIWMSRIGVGAPGRITPAGHFYVRDKLISNDPNGVYGPYAFGLSAYSKTLTDWPGGGIIGIHGTNEANLIPGRISHGCVRVPNKNIRKLHKLMPPGTPVDIQ